MITVDNITVEQLRSLRQDADPKVRKAARCALGESRGGATAKRNARARCAEILNARAATKPKLCPVCLDDRCETKSEECGK